jgi:ATP/maltotriose-dependent transcriptional regulator MalT
LALLRFSQGRTAAALSALTLAVSAPQESRLRHARLLAALVDVALAVPDVEAASVAAEHLSGLAAGAGASILHAMAATAAGAVQIARGDAPAAVDSLRRAGGMWRDLRLPYEAARARVLLGLALRATGDEDDAVLELRAAIDGFDRLGAVPDRDAASALLPVADALPAGLTSREAQVLRLVAAGRSNREIASELVISEHTVARHLQNMFAKLGVSSRSGATAFAFEHDLA